jgi:FKBP-type peptidyl-prolyl cis-trans isomerase SlpA
MNSEPIAVPLSATAAVVQAGSFLTLHYRLAGPDGGDIVNTFADKAATLSLGGGELSPPMEQCMLGMREGERRSFTLAPGEAFGPRNPDMVQRVGKSLLAEWGDPDATYTPGDVVQFPAPNGQGTFTGMVREVGDAWLLMDFNHPLAGQPVTFEVQVVGIL